jgi:hypothetical protein
MIGVRAGVVVSVQLGVMLHLVGFRVGIGLVLGLGLSLKLVLVLI